MSRLGTARAAAVIARVSEVASPSGFNCERSPGCSSGAARSENSTTCRSKSFFSFPDHSRIAGPRLVEPGGAGGVVGRGHRGRGIQRQDDAPPLELVALEAQDRAEQEQDDQQDRGRPQGQEEPPPRRHDLREDPAVEEPGQDDGRRGDRQHGQQAMPLLEREMKHGTCPVKRRPRSSPTLRILSGCPGVVKSPAPARPVSTKLNITTPTTKTPARDPRSVAFPESGPRNMIRCPFCLQDNPAGIDRLPALRRGARPAGRNRLPHRRNSRSKS